MICSLIGEHAVRTVVQRSNIDQAAALAEASAADKGEVTVWVTLQIDRSALEFGISGEEVSLFLDDFGRRKTEFGERALQPGYLVCPILVRS